MGNRIKHDMRIFAQDFHGDWHRRLVLMREYAAIQQKKTVFL